MSTLTVEGATRVFDGVPALDDVSFALEPGTLVGLVGPNGSGKSTLVNCIVGLDRPTAGRITVTGAAAGSAAAKRAVAFSPDELPLPELLTGREYVELVCDLERRPRTAALQLAEAFSLTSHLDKLVGSYSHGMKRRLQFSLTLSAAAPLLVLDEPFSGLDIEASVLLRAALRHLVGQGRTVLVTVHDMATAERECDHVVVLSEGTVVIQGNPAAVVAGSGLATLEDVVLELSGVADVVRTHVDLAIGSLA